MLEKDIEDDVIRLAEQLGGLAVKLKDDARGFPDRTILLPGGRVLFVELKLPKRHKRYFMQKRWIETLQRLGFVAEFCETVEQVEALCSKAVIPTRRKPTPSTRTKSKQSTG